MIIDQIDKIYALSVIVVTNFSKVGGELFWCWARRSGLSTEQVGQIKAYNTKAFNKLFKQDSKIDYLLRYKATLSEHRSQ